MLENSYVKIPKYMGNEESKALAQIINLQRERDIISGKLTAAINRYRKTYLAR